MKNIKKHFLNHCLLLFTAIFYSNYTFAEKLPILSSDSLKKDTKIVSLEYYTADRKDDYTFGQTGQFSGNSSYNFSGISLQGILALTNSLRVNLTIPNHLANEQIHKEAVFSNGNITNYEIEQGRDGGLGDISFGVVYVSKKSDDQRIAFGLNIDWDNAEYTAGQSQIETNGNITQEEKKSGTGKGYKAYTFGFAFAQDINKQSTFEFGISKTTNDKRDELQAPNALLMGAQIAHSLDNSLRLSGGINYYSFDDSSTNSGREFGSFDAILANLGAFYQAKENLFFNFQYETLLSSSDQAATGANETLVISRKQLTALIFGVSTSF